MNIPNTIRFLFALLVCCASSAQNPLDSLKAELVRYDRTKSAVHSLRDTVKVKLLQQLSHTLGDTDPDQALKFANLSLGLAKKIKHGRSIAGAYNCLGTIHQTQGNFALAIADFKQMQAWNHKLKDKISEASAVNALGQIYGESDNPSLAIKYFLHGLALSKAANDKIGIASSYNNIGVLYRQTGDIEKALENYLLAQRLMTELGNKQALAMLSHNIGQIYWAMEDSVMAIQSLKKGLAIAREVGDVRAEFRNWNGLGFIYGDIGKMDLALNCFGEALKINQAMGNVPGVGASYLSMGRTYFQKADYEKALEYGNKGLKIIVTTDDVRQKINAYELLSKVYKERKDYKKAYEYQEIFKTMNDSLLNIDKVENVERLRLKYDLKSAQDSTSAVQVKKDMTAAETIKIQRNTRNFISVVLGLVIVFLIILIWQRNKIATEKRQRALETERNRISRDLHDNLGAQLSTVRMFVSSLRNKPANTIDQTVENSIGLLDASISELRGIMDEMHGSLLLEKGYLAATEVLINKINELHDVQFSLTHHNMDQRARINVEHQLYRVTQELVNNTMKYARAQHVAIDILRRDGKLILVYEDDGVGFDLKNLSRGYGLRNIETRMSSIGGTVEFDSAPGTGTRAIIEIPE